MAAVVCAAGGAAAAPAQAGWTAALVGSTVTFTGDAVFDPLTLGHAGGLLSHNATNPAFSSELDFDAATAGIQTLGDAPGSSVVVHGGPNVDRVDIGTPGDVFQANFTFNGGTGADFFFPPAATTGPDTLTINGNAVSGLQSGTVAWDATTDQVNLDARDGHDTVAVTASVTSPQVLIRAGSGNDTLRLADGTGLGTGGRFTGGPGEDTLDLSAFTTPVSVDLGRTAQFTSVLNGAGQVPAVATAATGRGNVVFTDLATGAFDLDLEVSGLTAGQITDAHIHSGPAGTNGPVVFGIGAGGTWSDPATPFTEGFGLADADITEPLLRAGGTYFNVHTTAHPGGEIRGQLTVDPEMGYGGNATGVPRVFTVERAIGGSGADTLRGSVVANTLDCGPGADVESSDLTDTVIGCEALLAGTATVTGTTPASPADDRSPRVRGTATPAGLNVRLYTDPACTGTPTAVGSAADFAGAGIPVTVADGSLTTFYAAVADTANQGPCSATSATYQEAAAVPPPPPVTGTGTGTTLPGVPDPGPAPGASPIVAPLGTLSALAPKVSGSGMRVTIDTGTTAACPAGATSSCRLVATAKAKLRRRATTLGTRSTNVAVGRTLRVKLTLSRKQTAAWRRAGRLSIAFDVRLTVPGGAPVVVKRTVKLKAPARKRRG